MSASSIRGCRQDEWGELVLIVMKTSLSVAHELQLPPDAVLDCAARYLQFEDFPSFASATLGAARAHACCCRREVLPPVEVAYIKTLAARVDLNRNVLALMPAMHTVELQDDVGAPAHACDKVAAALQKLKEDVQRVFSLGGSAFSSAEIEGASGFAKALAAIMPADDDSDVFERAFAAVLRVRSSSRLHLVPGDAEPLLRVQGVDGPPTSVHLPSAPG
ncbi:hypothetical protein EVC45_02275 [Paraburkholderia sp. UYCP14C]|uniref:hypothetical protein n=1 Tax=Paraburkholderia sp. UYCP14C TaxID=2511130 RepID=UPI001020C023|nr:hypothetical protein [Paraburkholderia sp. UYCP14C]RZF31299.1 hypothetical protein EVC45_02275 [Paraburkholderia sp. UYCP14C]